MIVTETASQTPKPGRPFSVFRDAADRQEMIELFDDVRSERSVVNRLFHLDALMAIGEGDKPQYRWLADARTDCIKRTILAELGRVRDEEKIRELARYICEMKMSTAEAINFIRERRGVVKPISALKLEDELRTSIRRWLKANKSGTQEQVGEVLRKLMAGC